MKRTTITIALALLLGACGAEEPVETEPLVAERAPGQAPATVDPAATPHGSLIYDLPETWQRGTPSSSMRLDQAVIPGSAGAGELAVFFFGAGGGGSVEANLERWIGQMTTSREPRREAFETNGLAVTWIDVSGTLNPSGMGMGPTEPQPDSRMLAAVVEGPGGPWFFKATGPEATMEAARDQFVAMLQSAQLTS